MHPAPAFDWRDTDAAMAFVGAVSFAHLFAMTPAGPRVAHVPLLVAGDRIRFHLANANALTAHLDGAVALASITGANAYVSPNWYAAANQVPTWNYRAVEIEGPVARLDDAALVALLDDSAATFEPRVGEDWTRAKMDSGRFAKMCSAITGFELTATSVRATAKLSQNKPDADFAGAVAGLRATGHAVLADAMQAARGR